MTAENKSRNIIRRGLSGIGQLWRGIIYSIGRVRFAFGNGMRRIRRARLDYVIIPVGGSLPERSGPPRSYLQRFLPLPPRPMSMEALHRRFRLISEADNVGGVILVLGNITTGIATLQSLRRAVKRLQDAGKEVVVYTPMVDLGHYFVAVAADRIVIPPSANFEVLGLHADAFFLNDALNTVGVEAEVVQISPYKTGFDYMSKSDMSAEYREQIEWILDETYGYIIEAISAGRDMPAETVREIIDRAPYSAAEAREHGLVDDVAYEDTLSRLLAHHETDQPPASQTTEAESGNGTRNKKAKLGTWSRARRIMLRRYRRPLEKYIGVLSIEGMITPGVSRKPPFSIPLPIPFMGSETAGDESVLQLMRLAERDRQMAALVLYIDSPGGVHLSSDLIWRQIDRFSKKKPVVCVFGDVAASGGYYIGASATHIVAPELGITGSIGVYTAHVSARDLYEKLNIKRVVISRGQRSLLRSDVEPLDDEKREVLWNTISHVYDQFKTVVAKGRKKDIEQLEEVSGGRVWTGSQALNRGLVDSHGDMQDGLIIAAELAGLPIDEQHEVEAVNIYSRRDSYILPRAYEQVNDLTTSLSIDNILIYFNRPMTMLPFDIRIR